MDAFIVAKSNKEYSPFGEIMNGHFECFENVDEALEYGNELLMDYPEEDVEIFRLTPCAKTIRQFILE